MTITSMPGKQVGHYPTAYRGLGDQAKDLRQGLATIHQACHFLRSIPPNKANKRKAGNQLQLAHADIL